MNRLRFSETTWKKRRLALSVFGVFLLLSGIAFVVSGYHGPVVRIASAEGTFVSCEDAPEEAGICEDEAEIYIWRDYVIPENTEFRIGKTLYVGEGATLSVRPGARIVFAGPEDGNDDSEGFAELFLSDGKIEMIGTAERPIIIEREENGPGFSIDLREGEAEFDHVRIRRGGSLQAEDVRPAFLSPLFPATAYADDYYWSVIPAMKVGWATVSVRNSAFVDSEGADIHMARNVRDRYVDRNGDPRWEYSGTLLVENSDFDGDADVPAFLGNFETCDQPDCQKTVTLRNDWYGDVSGPRIAGYYAGRSGKEVLGAVTADGFSATSFFAVCEECASNVLFLPGIKASNLFMPDGNGGEDRLWIPNDFVGNDTEDLYFDDEGHSERFIYAKDVVDEIPFLGTNIYKSFLADLESLKAKGAINAYVPFAYDWRQNVDDIALYGTPRAPYPEAPWISPVDVTETLATSSKTGKVTIVAHSNGGLLAKAVILRLEELGESDLVDRIILVGTPQMGTPKSVLSLLYGYEESIPLLLKRSEARSLAETLPGAFGLLPSSEYLDRSKDNVVSFSSGNRSDRLSAYRDTYGESIDDWVELSGFLSGEDGREKPEAKDVKIENVLEERLLKQAEDLHRRLDGWVPPENVEVIQVAGWGLDTISGIRYEEKERGTCLQTAGKVPYCRGGGEYEIFYEPVFTVDGDKVVTSPSALMLPESENVRRYWVDLYGYEREVSSKAKHDNFLEIDFLRGFVNDLLTKNNSEISLQYIFSSRLSDYENAKPRIRMALYSPLDVSLIDTHGNRTGTVRIGENGEEYITSEEHIPGSSFLNLDERKYVSFPAGEPVDIRLDGYADGAYTLRFEEIKLTEAGEEAVSHTAFEYLPTTADTVVTLSVPEEGLSGLSPLVADIDGDGEPDYALDPVPDGIATLDISAEDEAPPSTISELSGLTGMNGWFLGDVTVTLSAADDGSGVASMEYSLDDGATWEAYTEPFTISEEGRTTVSYRSADEAGNIEGTKQKEIRIDRTAPTARIGFDPEMRKIVVSGSDGQSDVTVEREEEDISPKQKSWRNIFSWIPAQGRNDKAKIRVNVTLSDEAGHVTDIAFTEERKYGTNLMLSDFSVARDGDALDVSDVYASYQAVPGRWGRDYTFLSAFLKTDHNIVLARYFGRRDKTWIVSILEEVVHKEWRSGIVVPMLEAVDNGIKITWN